MKKIGIISISSLLFFIHCQSAIIKGHNFKTPDTYNLKFICYDNEINDPEKDRRSYLKILIDKYIEGRTTTGLESQKKTYTTKLSSNKHVLSVKKYTLDRKEKIYKRENNINQPKPAYTYFTIPDNRIVVIELKINKNNKALYEIYYEKDE